MKIKYRKWTDWEQEILEKASWDNLCENPAPDLLYKYLGRLLANCHVFVADPDSLTETSDQEQSIPRRATGN